MQVFCVLAVYRAATYILVIGDEPVPLAATLISLLFTLGLATLTLLGRILPRRLFAVLIFGNAVYLGWRYAMQRPAQPLLLTGVLLFAAYLAIGAVKLWRVKASPARLTAPPQA